MKWSVRDGECFHVYRVLCERWFGPMDSDGGVVGGQGCDGNRGQQSYGMSNNYDY